MFTVKAHGVPAHAGLDPEKGASAILELSRQIQNLHTLNNAAAGTTVNVCTAKGGTTTNVIPEHAECTVDVRFSTMEEAARIGAEIRSLMRSTKSFDRYLRRYKSSPMSGRKRSQHIQEGTGYGVKLTVTN